MEMSVDELTKQTVDSIKKEHIGWFELKKPIELKISFDECRELWVVYNQDLLTFGWGKSVEEAEKSFCDQFEGLLIGCYAFSEDELSDKSKEIKTILSSIIDFDQCIDEFGNVKRVKHIYETMASYEFTLPDDFDVEHFLDDAKCGKNKFWLISYKEYGLWRCKGVFFTDCGRWDRVILDIGDGFAYVNAPMYNTLSKEELAREVVKVMGGSGLRLDGVEV